MRTSGLVLGILVGVAGVVGLTTRGPVRGGPAEVTPGAAPSPRTEAVRVPGAPEGLAAVSYEGRPAPGLAVTLRAEPTGEGPITVRWVQAGGPPIALDDATGTTPRFIVPADAGLIEMVAFVSDGQRVESRRLSIPVEGAYAVGLRADAGDDQLARIGHRVTLNGLRSEPHGQIGFRWLQVGGPPATLAVEDGSVYSFVPTEPGLYRFALVVASAGVISAPDPVTVLVEAPPAAAVAPAVVPASAPPSPSLVEVVANLPGGPDVMADLGRAFRETAERVDLYGSYEELQSELSRRVEALLPADPAARRHWETQVFTPLSAPLVVAARRQGIDLSTAVGQRASLPNPLRRQIGDHFRAIARELGAGGVEEDGVTNQARPDAPVDPATADREDDR